MDQRKDRELVVRAMAGDRLALDTLWQAHRRWVATVLLAHLPGAVDLEDLLQDVAVKMLSQLKSLKNPDTFRPWLRTVARNVAASAGRHRRVRQRRSAVSDVEPIDPAHAEALRIEPVRDRLEATLAIVAGLHLDYREPLLMRCVEGMSQDAIAAALDLPVTTIETRLARARRLLRKEMARADLSAAPLNGESK